MGPFAAVTVPHTGRSPDDRFTVEEPSTAGQIDWGSINRPMSEAHYRALRADIIEYLNARELFVRDAHCGADSAHRISVRVVSPSAWHTLFVYNMFLRPSADELGRHPPRFRRAARPLAPGRPGAPRHPQRHCGGREPGRADRAGGRHPLRGRDQEIHLLVDELLPARQGRAPHALLGQHRRRRGHRTLLRAVGDQARPRSPRTTRAG